MLLAHHENPILPLADGTWDWFRPSASTTADSVDVLFWGITVVNIVFFVLIVGLMGLFLLWYRKRPGHTAEHSPHHNNTIEIIWSVIPLLIVVVMFGYGFYGFMKMRVPPEDAYEINVSAKKWSWNFSYPEGINSPDLHVPVDRPVKLILSSDDVIHSLFIPAFRVKMDCVPGRYNTMWFEATKESLPAGPDGEWIDANNNGRYDSGEGGYDLFCTEYCGTGHSSMIAKVHVYDSAGFEDWKKRALNVRTQGPPAEVGAKLYNNRGCNQCHSIDGTDRPGNGGPSFKGHFGKTQAFVGGGQHEVDENYIRESILTPMAKVRAGYKPIMPPYQGMFNNDEIMAIIAYIKTLNGVAVPETWPAKEGEEGEQGEGGEAPAGGEAAAAETSETPTTEDDAA